MIITKVNFSKLRDDDVQFLSINEVQFVVWELRQIELINRLRDVTPSHITSLDVTPSEVRTLEVLISGHYTFEKLHLWAVLPSGHYTFGTLQLCHITPATVSLFRRPKVKSPMV